MESGLRFGVTAASVGLILVQSAWGQVKPLRTPPVEKLTVNPGFRDWGPATVAGTTILAGNQTGRGGLFAVDTTTGKLKWSHRPTFPSGTASVSTPPAVSGDVVIVPYATAYPGAVVALSLATGKELWRGPDPLINAAVATNAGLAFILGKNGTFYALDVATGRERWKVQFADRPSCVSWPIVRDDVIYLNSSAAPTVLDKSKPAVDSFLFAIDAKTGQERWRYRAEEPYVFQAVCLSQPVVTAETIYATGSSRLYAVDRATGRERWKPVEVRRPVDGRVRLVNVFGLIDAGPVLVGLTSGFLIAFDKETGRTAWDIPGRYNQNSPSTAVASGILYFQGSPNSKPAPEARGTLHALDLETREILWSFSRPTGEANWSFGHVTPVDGGLWVDSYQSLVKLQ